MTTMTTGILICTDGTAEAVEVASDSAGHLAHMRTLVGADYLDVVGIASAYGPIDAWVNDEGAFTAIPNVAATVILSEVAGRQMQPLFGPALLLSRDGADTIALSADQAEYVTEIHALASKMPKLHESIARAHAEAALSGRH